MVEYTDYEMMLFECEALLSLGYFSRFFWSLLYFWLRMSLFRVTVRRFSMAASTIYSFNVKDANGAEISLDKYKGKVVLIVNVASQCGLTNSNYTQLKDLLDKHKDEGLEVAAFPCNQFGGQEPACEIDIRSFVQDKFKFEPDLFAKIDVNGDKADPLYKFLKKQQGGTLIDAIKWNFTKFLVNRNGEVVKRYGPTTEPKDFEKDIIEELKKPAKL